MPKSRWSRRMGAAVRAGRDPYTLRVAVGVGAAQAAGTVFVTGLVLATHGLLAGLIVGAAAIVGRLLGGLLHQIVRPTRRVVFVVTGAVGLLAAAALTLRLSTMPWLAVAAGLGCAFLGLLVERLPAGVHGPLDGSAPDLASLLTAIGSSVALIVTVAADLVGGAHRGLGWVLTVTGLVAAAVALTGPRSRGAARPAGTAYGPVIGVPGSGRFRSLCARLRWWPLIPVAAALAVPNVGAAFVLFVAWQVIAACGLDRRGEDLRNAMREVGQSHRPGEIAFGLADADPEFAPVDASAEPYDPYHEGYHRPTGGFGGVPGL